MAKKSKRPKKPQSPPFNQAFAELAQLKAGLNEQAPAQKQSAPVVHKAQIQTRHIAPEQNETPNKPLTSGSAGGYGSEKIVIRREPTSRGKILTRVQGIVGPMDEIEFLAVLMKRKLGCDASVENGAIVLYGRHDRHAAEWLRSWGAEQVVIDR